MNLSKGDIVRLHNPNFGCIEGKILKIDFKKGLTIRTGILKKKTIPWYNTRIEKIKNHFDVPKELVPFDLYLFATVQVHYVRNSSIDGIVGGWDSKGLVIIIEDTKKRKKIAWKDIRRVERI